MNCIFICAFHNPNYFHMLLLLLESIFLYSDILYTNDTEILIYTNKIFYDHILKHPLHQKYSKYIHFQLRNFVSKSEICRARLDIFKFDITKKYKKILYLDTDIIIKGNLSQIFDIACDEILYTLEEGTIDSDTNYWGKYLFKKSEMESTKNKSAFSSGILLFKNCKPIQDLFDEIKKDMSIRKNLYYDQPFFVYNAFKFNIFDNQLLKPYAINVERNSNCDNYSICHFYGGLGISDFKLTFMKNFLGKLKYQDKINKNKMINYQNDNLILHESK